MKTIPAKEIDDLLELIEHTNGHLTKMADEDRKRHKFTKNEVYLRSAERSDRERHVNTRWAYALQQILLRNL